MNWLLADTEPLDQLGVAVRVLALEVIEQAPALADEFEQPTARVMVFGVRLEVFGQVVDAFAQNRDLNFRRAGIFVVRPIAAR